MKLTFHILLLATLCIIGALFLLDLNKQKLYDDLAILGDAPSFELTTSTSAAFNSESLSGKVWVVNFFFSRCPHVCPKINQAIGTLYRENPAVHFVSISIDPEHDTPEVLSKYADRFGATPDRWNFLTGPSDELKKVVENGFLFVSRGDQNLHTSQVVLVDKLGQIRGYYPGLEQDSMEQLAKDLQLLL